MPDVEAHHDVAVVGGGLVGAVAALGLARQGRDVVLLEPVEPRPERGALGMDLRTVAVSPASRVLLEGLGVWGGFPAAPYRRMEVWEERGTRAITFDAAQVNRQELGWIVENGALVQALREALTQQSGISVRSARVAGVRPLPEQVRLSLDDGTVWARLVVAADGGASAVRRALGVAVRRFDTGHVALATVARTERAHDATAYQRFLLEGPVALLPGVEPRLCSVVWSQPPEQARRRQALDDAAFAAELGRAVQGRLGAVQAVDRRVAFPLRQQLAASFNPLPRVLLVGDAARVVHPLAGLGANLGLDDVREVLERCAELGAAADPGAEGLWRAFDRRRRLRSELMIGVMGALQRVYARGDPLSQWVRNLGVGWLDRATPLKRQIMMEAMGFGAIGGRTGSAAR